MEKFNHKTASIADLTALYNHLGDVVKDCWENISDPDFADQKDTMRALIGKFANIRGLCYDEIEDRLSEYMK